MNREAMVKQALNGRASKYPLSAQTVPMEVALANKQDPSVIWPGAPPNWGQPDMPHIFSFVGRYGLIANSYAHADESLIHNSAHAEIMRNEPMIMECIEARMRCVALLNWHIQPVDNDVLRDALDKTDSQETAMSIRRALKKPKSDAEQIADKLTSILRHTPQFMKLRYSLMDAIWYGKTATAQTMGVRNIGGQRRIFVRKWEPRHGDKLIFRYADESYEYDPEQVGIRIGPTTHGHDDTWVDYAGFERKRIDPTQHGLVYWFDGQQRKRMCIHRHIIEDGDFMRPEKAGSIQGIGIRSRIYWTWWAYQECLKLLLEYIERSALGIEIWKYPAHDPKAKERTEKAIQDRGSPGRSAVLVPIPTGEYGDMYGVQIVEPGLGGINELQNVLQEFFGHKIKRYILGQVLTSEAAATGMGSGVADAHLATFHDIVRFDGLNLEETITTDLLRPLQQWNFPGTDDVFLRFVIDTESPDAQERIGSYQAAWSMGLKIRTEDMYDALGAAPPAEGEEFLSNPGLESAVIANEAQKMQMAQMEAQMQAQPAMFGPFPDMGGGGVPGDGDGDGLANDEQAQLYRSSAKVDRYAVKKNGLGVERYELKTNLSDEHHKAIADWIMHGVNSKELGKFRSDKGYSQLGIPHNHPLTGDDQHLIMFHTGNMGDIGLGKKVWGDSYSDQHLINGGPELPDMDLRSFANKAARGILYHGIDQRKQAAIDRVKDAKVVSFKHPDRGRQVLHPAVRKDAGSPWQLTQISSHDGKPWGHHNPKDFTEGVHDAIQSGYEVEWTDKDGTKSPFSATGDYWLEVERFGRVKPMAGQRAFNWDEEQHPRESEEHDGKRPGEFAPKEQAESKTESEADPEHQKLLDEARAARKWTPNGDGTYTAPNGTVWRKAKEGGEISPVTGKPFVGGRLMPIHGLAAPKPKIEPKPKGSGDNSVAPNEESKKEWKAPKVRQLSESEIAERRERQEEQRRWDAVRATPLAEVYWLGDAPTFANWKATRNSNMLTYLAKLQPEQVKSLGQQLRAKLIEREVNQYFNPGENERVLRGETISRAELAKRVAEDFDHYAEADAGVILTKKLRKLYPGIEAAVWGLKSWFDKRLPVEHAEELAAILPKPGTVDRLSAEDWAEVERYARLKPMAGQSAFDWDEAEHPRETEAHDDKKPGEFAPKESTPAGDGKAKAKEMLSGKSGDKYANRVQATLLHTGTTASDWQAVPVVGMNQVDNGRGGQATVPVFDMPKGYKRAETPFSQDEKCCHLCGKGIKNVWHIMAPEHKLTMAVGSECVGRFGEGISGERQAKRDIHAQRRDFVGQLENLQQALKDVGMKEYQQREHGHDKEGNLIYWTRTLKAWDKGTAKGQRAGELHSKLNAVLSYNRSKITAGKNRFGEWHESDQRLANWEKLKGEQAKGLHAEISAFLAESKPKQAEARPIPVHPDILDEWRSSERWAYDNADEWAHANDADPADFDKWVQLRDKVQSVSEAVPPELQFHLWDWLNEQADGDIPAGWKQAEKQLGARLGIYRPWNDDDAKAVEFTSRGQRAAKPLFKLGGQSFALDDKRLQELQTQRYGQMFFDFDKPAKQPAPESQAAKPEPPAGSLAAKLKKYLDLQQDAAKRGLQQPRTNLLK